MARLLRVLAVSFGIILPVCPAFAGQPVTITNPGFEQPVLSPCQFNGAITGWSVPSGGVWQPLPCWATDYPNGVPEGVQLGFSNGGDISQVLTSSLQPLTEYTLTVEVGRRATCCGMQDYKVQLRAGGILLAEDPGLLDPAPGTFDTSVVNFVVGTSHPALGQPLEIRLVQVSGQANFDDVHLDAGPADCNNNGILDSIDIANGTSEDDNGNGLPDECEQSCPADVNDSGTVDIDDLFGLIGAWGTGTPQFDVAPPGAPNGLVDIDDLFFVIGAWGPC